MTAILVAILAGPLPIGEIAALANAGTLIAFMAVSACLIVLRRRSPELRRPFRTPAATLIGLGAIFACAYLFASLQAKTLLWCLLWNVIGLAIYLGYAHRHSALRS